MAHSKKHTITVVEHVDGDTVYNWGVDAGLETIKSCLRRGEAVSVSTTQMTEKEYDELPEYEGEC